MAAPQRTTPPGPDGRVKTTVSLPEAWDAELRQLAAERGETISDAALSAIRLFSFLSESHGDGYRFYLGRPDEPVQREVVFLELANQPKRPAADELELDERIDQRMRTMLEEMNAPGAAESTRAAMRADAETIGQVAHQRATSAAEKRKHGSAVQVRPASGTSKKVTRTNGSTGKVTVKRS